LEPVDPFPAQSLDFFGELQPGEPVFPAEIRVVPEADLTEEQEAQENQEALPASEEESENLKKIHTLHLPSIRRPSAESAMPWTNSPPSPALNFVPCSIS
jgi:hypothetical protein